MKIDDGKAEEAPEFSATLKAIQAIEGEPAKFECAIKPKDGVQVRWYKVSSGVDIIMINVVLALTLNREISGQWKYPAWSAS